MKRSSYLLTALIVLTLSITAHAKLPQKTVYGIIGRYNDAFSYQLGYFDLGNPSGMNGSYSFQWNAVGDNHPNALANLAMAQDGTMYANTGFSEHRTISAEGVLSSKLGDLPGPYSLFGMAFGGSGNLYGTDGSDWLQINPDTGAELSRVSMTNALWTLYGSYGLYSSFGGNLAWSSSDSQFYFADGYSSDLYSIALNGTPTKVNTLSGTDFDANYSIALFEAEGYMFLLNGARLYYVNTSDASLYKLGTVSGLPSDVNEYNVFTGAVTTSAVPEPATVMLIAPGIAILLIVRRQMRYYRS